MSDTKTQRGERIIGYTAIGRYLGVSKVTVRTWCEKELPEAKAVRPFGNRVFAFQADLDLILEGRASQIEA